MSTDDVCTQVLTSKSLYEVLSVEKTCTAEDIKRSYRRLAKLVHPDRCHHERATEAFQRISHAYQILSDEDKRAHYDRFGEQQPGNPNPGPRQNVYQGGNYQFYGYQDDITPEDLFNAFFGGGFVPQRGRYRRAPQPNYDMQQVRPNWQILVLVVAMVAMLAMNWWAQSGIDWRRIIVLDEDLNQRVYEVYVSPRMGKRYGVRKEWVREMTRTGKMTVDMRTEMGKAADEIYIGYLSQRCREEAYFRRDRPSCDELRRHGVRVQ
jgi:hypothetical protein